MTAKGRSRTLATHERGNEDLDKKRLRNRLSQRAFRRRQADRLRELLDHADASDRPYDETVKVLQEEK
ncbi:hypothetical protein N7526_000173 [Penicillium atrosanguineum]|nr:hypothetical protein N7526_000173 [Penicillium atrosanguineum]